MQILRLKSGPVRYRFEMRPVVSAATSRLFTALLNAGVLERTESGRIVFPFEAVKVELLLQAA